MKSKPAVDVSVIQVNYISPDWPEWYPRPVYRR